MKVGVYCDYWGWISGGARFVGVLAESLSRQHEVEFIHHREDFPHDQIAEALQVDLSGISFRYVPRPRRSPNSPTNPLRYYRSERDYLSEISADCDFFLNASDNPPIFCHAQIGVMLIQFPMATFDRYYGRGRDTWNLASPLSKAARRIYQSVEWSKRFASYRHFLTNSCFSQKWIKRRWGIDASVVYPPLRPGITPRPKRNLIISLSRYSPSRAKNQGQLISAFKTLSRSHLRDWEYVLVGGTRSGKGHEEYLRELRAEAEGYPIRVLSDVSSAELKDLLGTATIFWHSKGFGIDPEVRPEDMEHFGMVTTEAMSAGCIPIVYDAGGQREIVRHGQDGFLWGSIAELIDLTTDVANDSDARDQLKDAARERSRAFSQDRTIEDFQSVINPFLAV